MKIKHIFILTILSVVVFGCTLFNQFVGDDHVLFELNTFYTSFSHWPDLFTKKYSTTSTMDNSSTPGKPYHSGSVAYRPVLSLTFFGDYGLWKLKPWGYHLDNLILHTLNTVLVYLLLVRICQNPSMAFFAACLFCVHPIKVEAVASIGYRADLLACFWQLLSFLSFIAFRHQAKMRYWILCLLFYFLGLFTKESALILPLIFLAYDFYFTDRKIVKSTLGQYATLMAVSGFYLYVYGFVFPNTSLTHVQYLGGTLGAHITIVFWILARYMTDLLLPFMVNMLPPLYLPSIEPYSALRLLAGVFVFLGFIIACIKSYKTNKTVSFFLLFFLLAWLPIANIIPLANPMAHRFLYFPSIAFVAVVGLLWERGTSNLSLVLKIALIGLCIVYTVPLNMRWNNDVSVARTLLESYPNNPKAHLILAMQYLEAGDKPQARQELNTCIALGDKDPWIYYLLSVTK